MAFERELTRETINLPLGCIQGGEGRKRITKGKGKEKESGDTTPCRMTRVTFQSSYTGLYPQKGGPTLSPEKRWKVSEIGESPVKEKRKKRGKWNENHPGDNIRANGNPKSGHPLRMPTESSGMPGRVHFWEVPLALMVSRGAEQGRPCPQKSAGR